MHDTVTHKSPVEIYDNRIHNGITFKNKTGYYLELLIPKTMKLLGSTERRITKDNTGENMPQLEITEVSMINISVIQRSCVLLFRTSHLVSYEIFQQQVIFT